MAEGKNPVAAECPLDEIRDKAASYQQCIVTLKRPNAKGQWQTVIGNLEMETLDLANLGPFLREHAGGGRFRVDVFSKHNMTEHMMTSWYETIEGPLLPWNPMGYSNTGGAPMGGPQQTQQLPSIPAWAGGLPPQQAVAYAQGQQHLNQQAAPMNEGRFPASQQMYSKTPDEIAVRQAERLERQLDAERRLRDEERKANEMKLRELEARIEADRRKHEEEQRRLEREMFEKRMEMLAQQQSAPKGPSPMEALAPLFAAIAPVMAAYVQANKEKESKALEMQMQGMNTLLAAGTAKNNDDDKVLRLIMPLLQENIKSRSPEAQVKAMQMMSQQHLDMMGMAASLAERQQEMLAQQTGNAEPMVQLFANAFDGGLKVFQEYIQAKQAEVEREQRGAAGLPPGQAAPKQIAQPAAGQAPQAAAKPAVAVPGTPGEQVAQLVKVHPQVPGDLKTAEWLRIIADVHDKRPVEDVATLLLKHLDALEAFGRLPEVLTDVFTNTDEALMRVLAALPINQQSPEYVKELIEAVHAHLAPEDGEEEEHAPGNGAYSTPPLAAQEEIASTRIIDSDEAVS